MDIQNIKTFMCVAKLENYSKAAEELNYAQSTVTMQLQNLEKELGFQLFERIGRKNHLTLAGKEFLVYAEELLSLTEKIGFIWKDIKTLKGIIRIGILESLLFAKLLPVLSTFRKNFPNLEVNIKIGQTSELKELLKQNKLDIIYVSTDENTDPALNCCYKKRDELVFAVSPNHTLASSENIKTEEVFKYPFILTEPTGYCYKRLSEIAAEKNCTLQHGIVVDSISAIITLVNQGNSVAFLPKYSLKESIEQRKLAVVSSDLPSQFYYSQLLCNKGKWMSPFIHELISNIKENV